MTPFSIQYQLPYKDYAKLSFNLLFRKPTIIIYTVLGVLSVMTFAVSFAQGQFPSFNVMSGDWSFQGTLIFSVFLTLNLSLTFFYTRSVYKSNARLNEIITYTFTPERFETAGDSFTATHNWNKVYKVRTLKSFLLIYHSRATFSIVRIPAENQAEVTELKTLLKSSGYKIKVK